MSASDAANDALERELTSGGLIEPISTSDEPKLRATTWGLIEGCVEPEFMEGNAMLKYMRPDGGKKFVNETYSLLLDVRRYVQAIHPGTHRRDDHDAEKGNTNERRFRCLETIYTLQTKAKEAGDMMEAQFQNGCYFSELEAQLEKHGNLSGWDGVKWYNDLSALTEAQPMRKRHTQTCKNPLVTILRDMKADYRELITYLKDLLTTQRKEPDHMLESWHPVDWFPFHEYTVCNVIIHMMSASNAVNDEGLVNDVHGHHLASGGKQKKDGGEKGDARSAARDRGTSELGRESLERLLSIRRRADEKGALLREWDVAARQSLFNIRHKQDNPSGPPLEDVDHSIATLMEGMASEPIHKSPEPWKMDGAEKVVMRETRRLLLNVRQYVEAFQPNMHHSGDEDEAREGTNELRNRCLVTIGRLQRKAKDLDDMMETQRETYLKLLRKRDGLTPFDNSDVATTLEYQHAQESENARATVRREMEADYRTLIRDMNELHGMDAEGEDDMTAVKRLCLASGIYSEGHSDPNAAETRTLRGARRAVRARQIVSKWSEYLKHENPVGEAPPLAPPMYSMAHLQREARIRHTMNASLKGYGVTKSVHAAFELPDGIRLDELNAVERELVQANAALNGGLRKALGSFGISKHMATNRTIPFVATVAERRRNDGQDAAERWAFPYGRVELYPRQGATVRARENDDGGGDAERPRAFARRGGHSFQSSGRVKKGRRGRGGGRGRDSLGRRTKRHLSRVKHRQQHEQEELEVYHVRLERLTRLYSRAKVTRAMAMALGVESETLEKEQKDALMSALGRTETGDAMDIDDDEAAPADGDEEGTWTIRTLTNFFQRASAFLSTDKFSSSGDDEQSEMERSTFARGDAILDATRDRETTLKIERSRRTLENLMTRAYGVFLNADDLREVYEAYADGGRTAAQAAIRKLTPSTWQEEKEEGEKEGEKETTEAPPRPSSSSSPAEGANPTDKGGTGGKTEGKKKKPRGKGSTGEKTTGDNAGDVKEDIDAGAATAPPSEWESEWQAEVHRWLSADFEWSAPSDDTLGPFPTEEFFNLRDLRTRSKLLSSGSCLRGVDLTWNDDLAPSSVRGLTPNGTEDTAAVTPEGRLYSPNSVYGAGRDTLDDCLAIGQRFTSDWLVDQTIRGMRTFEKQREQATALVRKNQPFLAADEHISVDRVCEEIDWMGREERIEMADAFSAEVDEMYRDSAVLASKDGTIYNDHDSSERMLRAQRNLMKSSGDLAVGLTGDELVLRCNRRWAREEGGDEEKESSSADDANVAKGPVFTVREQLMEHLREQYEARQRTVESNVLMESGMQMVLEKDDDDEDEGEEGDDDDNKEETTKGRKAKGRGKRRKKRRSDGPSATGPGGPSPSPPATTTTTTTTTTAAAAAAAATKRDRKGDEGDDGGWGSRLRKRHDKGDIGTRTSETKEKQVAAGADAMAVDADGGGQGARGRRTRRRRRGRRARTGRGGRLRDKEEEQAKATKNLASDSRYPEQDTIEGIRRSESRRRTRQQIPGDYNVPGGQARDGWMVAAKAAGFAIGICVTVGVAYHHATSDSSGALLSMGATVSGTTMAIWNRRQNENIRTLQETIRGTSELGSASRSTSAAASQEKEKAEHNMHDTRKFTDGAGFMKLLESTNTVAKKTLEDMVHQFTFNQANITSQTAKKAVSGKAPTNGDGATTTVTITDTTADKIDHAVQIDMYKEAKSILNKAYRELSDEKKTEASERSATEGNHGEALMETLVQQMTAEDLSRLRALTEKWDESDVSFTHMDPKTEAARYAARRQGASDEQLPLGVIDEDKRKLVLDATSWTNAIRLIKEHQQKLARQRRKEGNGGTEDDDDESETRFDGIKWSGRELHEIEAFVRNAETRDNSILVTKENVEGARKALAVAISAMEESKEGINTNVKYSTDALVKNLQERVDELNNIIRRKWTKRDIAILQTDIAHGQFKNASAAIKTVLDANKNKAAIDGVSKSFAEASKYGGLFLPPRANEVTAATMNETAGEGANINTDMSDSTTCGMIDIVTDGNRNLLDDTAEVCDWPATIPTNDPAQELKFQNAIADVWRLMVQAPIEGGVPPQDKMALNRGEAVRLIEDTYGSSSEPNASGRASSLKHMMTLINRYVNVDAKRADDDPLMPATFRLDLKSLNEEYLQNKEDPFNSVSHLKCMFNTLALVTRRELNNYCKDGDHPLSFAQPSARAIKQEQLREEKARQQQSAANKQLMLQLKEMTRWQMKMSNSHAILDAAAQLVKAMVTWGRPSARGAWSYVSSFWRSVSMIRTWSLNVDYASVLTEEEANHASEDFFPRREERNDVGGSGGWRHYMKGTVGAAQMAWRLMETDIFSAVDSFTGISDHMPDMPIASNIAASLAGAMRHLARPTGLFYILVALTTPTTQWMLANVYSSMVAFGSNIVNVSSGILPAESSYQLAALVSAAGVLSGGVSMLGHYSGIFSAVGRGLKTAMQSPMMGFVFRFAGSILYYYMISGDNPGAAALRALVGGFFRYVSDRAYDVAEEHKVLISKRVAYGFMVGVYLSVQRLASDDGSNKKAYWIPDDSNTRDAPLLSLDGLGAVYKGMSDNAIANKSSDNIYSPSTPAHRHEEHAIRAHYDVIKFIHNVSDRVRHQFPDATQINATSQSQTDKFTKIVKYFIDRFVVLSDDDVDHDGSVDRALAQIRTNPYEHNGFGNNFVSPAANSAQYQKMSEFVRRISTLLEQYLQSFQTLEDVAAIAKMFATIASCVVPPLPNAAMETAGTFMSQVAWNSSTPQVQRLASMNENINKTVTADRGMLAIPY